MNNEMLVVMLIISPLIGVIIGYIVSRIQSNRRRKSVLTIDEDTKESVVDMDEFGVLTMSKYDKADIPDPILELEKKEAAFKSIREFRERVMSFSPIKLINEVEVTVVKKNLNKTFDRVTHKQHSGELDCLRIEFYLNERYYRETIYSEYTFPYNGYYINGYEKYSLEELQGYDWIISEMFNIVEERKEEILKEKIKDAEFVYSICSHNLIK